MSSASISDSWVEAAPSVTDVPEETAAPAPPAAEQFAADPKAPAARVGPTVAPKALPPKAPLTNAAPAPIGILPSGTPVSASFQPTVASLSISLTPFLSTAVGLSKALPLPSGLSLMRSPDDKQTQLKLEPFFAKKLRRVFGYVAETTLSSGEGTDTTAQLQIVTRIPRRYGSTDREKELSWILVRLQAFVPKALFASADRVVALGSFFCGFTEPTGGNSKSCQIAG